MKLQCNSNFFKCLSKISINKIKIFIENYLYYIFYFLKLQIYHETNKYT